MNRKTFTVTLFYYDEDEAIYKPKVYYNAMAHSVHGINQSDKGMDDANKKTIRIFTEDNLEMYLNGYIRIGEVASELEKNLCNRITVLSDNRRGINRHWRLECE